MRPLDPDEYAALIPMCGEVLHAIDDHEEPILDGFAASGLALRSVGEDGTVYWNPTARAHAALRIHRAWLAS